MHKRRWLILSLFMPAYTVGLAMVATFALMAIAGEWDEFRPYNLVEDVIEFLMEPEWWLWAVVPSAIATATQVVFLAPIFSNRPPRGERSRPLSVSLTLGAIVAAALVTGLAFGIVALLSLIDPEGFPEDDIHPAIWLLLGLILSGSWVFWSACLLVFARGIWADRVLGRMVGLLLAGTALELLVLIPIDAMIRRRTDCYCATGSFFGLCLAVGAALWLAGPGVVIALGSRRHRAWRTTHCGRCGYPMGPSPGPVCSECGFEWKRSPKPRAPSQSPTKGTPEKGG